MVMLWSPCLQEIERDELIQAKDRELAHIRQQLRQLSHKEPVVILQSSCPQGTERDNLLQAKDRELAEVQQHLRQPRPKAIQTRAGPDHLVY